MKHGTHYLIPLAVAVMAMVVGPAARAQFFGNPQQLPLPQLQLPSNVGTSSQISPSQLQSVLMLRAARLRRQQ